MQRCQRRRRVLLHLVIVLSLLPFIPFASSRHKIKLDARLSKHDHPKSSIPSNGFDPSKVIQLLWHPRLFLYEMFLSDEECDHLISLADAKREKLIIQSSAENDAASSINVGNEVLVLRDQDSIISRIEERLSTWTFLPKENGEDMQISHYGVNESYEPRHDYFQDESKLAYGGYIVATVLMYLSNASKGGEMILPLLQLNQTEINDKELSACSAASYSVKPVRGTALVLLNLYPDATPDESSLPGGCMVQDGEVWVATKWIHMRAFSPDKPKPSMVNENQEECTDEDPNCADWAAKGECQRNSVYMLGTPDYYGSCRKSCAAC